MKMWTTTAEKSISSQVPPRWPSMWWTCSPFFSMASSQASDMALIWVVEVAVQITK